MIGLAAQPRTGLLTPRHLLAPRLFQGTALQCLGSPKPRNHHLTSGRSSTVTVCTQRRPETETKKTSTASKSVTTKEQGQQPGWGLLDPKAYAQPWQVPWGAKELTLGMVGWAVTFVLVGLTFIPVAGFAAGPKGFAALSSTDKALFTLANQVAETAVGIGVIRLAVRGFEPLPTDFLKIDIREPIKRPYGWLAWALVGMSLSPLVVLLASAAVESVGYNDTSGRGTVDAVSSIISLDGPTYAALFSTTAILAPLLEETVFRGFLLTTLTKWLPVPAAVLVSSLAFGAAHFTPKDFPQLTALGILLGFSYVRSRNLLTPMVIHGAWNGTVLTILFMLTSLGVNVDQLTHGQL